MGGGGDLGSEVRPRPLFHCNEWFYGAILLYPHLNDQLAVRNVKTLPFDGSQAEMLEQRIFLRT